MIEVKSSSLIDPPIETKSSHIVCNPIRWVCTIPLLSHFSDCSLRWKSTVIICNFFSHLLVTSSHINCTINYFQHPKTVSQELYLLSLASAQPCPSAKLTMQFVGFNLSLLICSKQCRTHQGKCQCCGFKCWPIMVHIQESSSASNSKHKVVLEDDPVGSIGQ